MTDLSIVRGAGIAIEHPAHPYLRRAEAAAYVTDKYFPCSPRTLAKKAVVGGGPAYRLAGRIPLYSETGLDEWAKSKIGPVVRSSSDARAPKRFSLPEACEGGV
ncbi:hypothetical protein LGH83_06320 [Lichenihabitans sp. PAMC28606]|uniref:hypothetical protein n=1 Tax=Lichenihabitans sp. PAMC28606 TaxID=2880932 RepID=UPI001D09F6B3|nr:hypothetical protein [Lichenihabitans sp. PAMC28606]UDL95814.1 hypothetical protein LGH83_06320 [Lichenihabitans sp. PAMC28606]